MPRAPAQAQPEGEADPARVVPVIEESLDVRRRVVDTGVVVQVGKVVSENRVPVTESLVSEYVDTERVPVGRVIDEPAVVRHEGDVMVVPVVHERLVVRKELFLVEELRVTRRREAHEASAEVTLRRESLQVRRLDPATGQWHEEDSGRAADRPPGPDPPC